MAVITLLDQRLGLSLSVSLLWLIKNANISVILKDVLVDCWVNDLIQHLNFESLYDLRVDI